MKVVERIVEYRIRQQIDIDDMQFVFMKGKGTTDAIFIVRQMPPNFRGVYVVCISPFLKLAKMVTYRIIGFSAILA